MPRGGIVRCSALLWGGWRDADVLDQDLRSFAEKFARFTDRFGETMPPGGAISTNDCSIGHLSCSARYHSRRNLTIIHGDAHPWNFFCPGMTERGNVRLIDWESWSIDTATDDMAYMMAMLWYPDRRRRLERPLLDLYHAELVSHGVSGCDRQALQRRLSPVSALADHKTGDAGREQHRSACLVEQPGAHNAGS